MKQITPSQNRINTIHKDYSHIYRYMRGIALVGIGIWIGTTLFGDTESYITNIFTEIIGIFATYLIFDEITKRSAKQDFRQQLIADLKNRGISPAGNALDRLRREGWLEDQYFVGGDLSYANWERAYIGELNLEGTNLMNANLSKASCVKSGNYFPANFKKANLEFATLEGAILDDSNFEEAILENCNLQGVSLYNANLNNASLWLANLSGANMIKTSMKESDFKDANLKNTRLDGAQLQGARLEDTQLQGADLSGANLGGADMVGAQLNEVIWDTTTILPDGKLYTQGMPLERFTDKNHPEFLETLFDINEVRKSYGLDFVVPLPWGYLYYYSEYQSFYASYWGSIHELHQKARLNSNEILSHLDNFFERFTSAAEKALTKFE